MGIFIVLIRTGQDLKWARAMLGMTVNDLSDVLRLSYKNGSRTIRRWETGEVPITGPAQVAIEAMLAGFVPEMPDDVEY